MSTALARPARRHFARAAHASDQDSEPPAHAPARAPVRSVIARRIALALVLAVLAVPGPAGPCAEADAAGGPPRWEWPLAPRPAVAGAYRPPAKKWLTGHRGVDLAAAEGQEVRSPAAGTVTFSGKVVDRVVVTVTTAEGRKASFEPVEDPLPTGTSVARGQRVADRAHGTPHEQCGSCLHWGVREGEEYVNPLQFVGDLRPSVLLPVPEEMRR